MTEPDAPLNARPSPIGPGIWALLLVAIIGIVWSLNFQPEEPVRIEREVLLSLIARTNGLMYVHGSAEPFSGEVVEYYRTKALKSRTSVSNGLLHGMSRGWFTNGVLQIAEPFAHGRSHGPRIKFHPSGEKLSEANIENGELHGTFRRWHENGQLHQEVEMRKGQAHGLSRAWHTNGILKARVTLTNGVVVNQTFFDEQGKEIRKPEPSR